MWPAAFWEKLYEPMIRRAAGLGRAAASSPIPTTTRRPARIATCWSIGGGPAGLAAALAAGRAGARVILADEDFRLGGRLLAETARRSTAAGAGVGWPSVVAELAAMPEVRIMPRTTVFGVLRSRHLRRGRARQRSSGRAARA